MTSSVPRLAAFVTLIFLAAGGTVVHGDGCKGVDTTALSWLQKMSHGMHQQSYQGVVTLQRGQDTQVMHVSHLVHDGQVTEQMVQLTGQGAQVTRRAHPLECVHPGHRLLRLGDDLEGGNCTLAEQYGVRMDGGELVAGRSAVRLRVKPRDLFRYGYRLSLDKTTGLLLKTETFGPDGRLLEKFQYANLTYGDPVDGNALGASVTHQAAHPHPDHPPVKPATVAPWAVTWVPRGFEPTDAANGAFGRRSYTDGLAVFSVFVEEFARGARPGEGVVHEGGTTSYTRGIQLGNRAVLVTVIGEVPEHTARMVAESIRWGR